MDISMDIYAESVDYGYGYHDMDVKFHTQATLKNNEHQIFLSS